jgi:hypothetical protein
MDNSHEDQQQQQRRRRNAQRAALILHSQRDSAELTQNARAAFLERFEDEVDPRGILPKGERVKRARRAVRAYMIELSSKSAAARARVDSDQIDQDLKSADSNDIARCSDFYQHLEFLGFGLLEFRVQTGCPKRVVHKALFGTTSRSDNETIGQAIRVMQLTQDVHRLRQALEDAGIETATLSQGASWAL